MDDNLLIITNNYPYGKGEEFFETEIQYLSKNFDKIYIISFSTSPCITRTPPDNVIIQRFTNEKISVLDKINSLKYIFKKELWDELRIIKSDYKLRLNINILKNLLGMMYMGDKICEFIDEIISKENIRDKLLLYSYWLNIGAYAIAKYNNNKFRHMKKISRSHGIDLYFERNNSNYLPLRYYIINKLDNLFLISQDGKRYIQDKIKNIDYNKLIVAKLGINNLHSKCIPSTDSVFKIVSCSFIRDVKRVNLIIEALSHINEIKIKWTHIGDGDLRSEIEGLARNKLLKKENITYEFKGYMSNNEIYRFYENNEVDVFINVSESEGIPVSMMEAFSFSIPIIATNVGGVREIVNEGNGILISANPSTDEIKLAILKFKNLLKEEIQSYRENAYKTWKESYNADTNYFKFISMLKSGGY